MIDPSILLQAKPVQIQTPLDAATEAQNLQNLGTQNQLQKGQLAQQAANVAATEQENQQRQIELNNQAAINAEIPKHITVDPATGKPMIDHAGVVAGLTQAGMGTAALTYQQHATAVQKGVTDLADANEKLNNAHVANVASAAAAFDGKPPEAKAILYPLFVQSGIANGQFKPGDWPAQYDPSLDARIKMTAQLGQSSEQQAQLANTDKAQKIAQQNAESNARRADAAEARSDAYQEYIAHKDDATPWMKTGETRNGHAVYFNPTTRQEWVGGAVDMAPGKGGSGAATPGQQGVQQRFEDKEYDKARSTLDSIHQQRTALSTALATPNGQTFSYPDPKTGKPGPQQTMSDQVRAGLQQQFNNQTNQGLRIMKDFKIPNEFSDMRVQQPAPAATPTPAPTAPPAAKPNALPQGNGRSLDKATAQQFFDAAGGDKQKARRMASEAGWKF